MVPKGLVNQCKLMLPMVFRQCFHDFTDQWDGRLWKRRSYNRIRIWSIIVIHFEAKDFDGIANEVRIFANSEPPGIWPPQNLQSGNANNNTTNNPNAKAAIREGDTGRFSVNWDPLYPGTYSITTSVEDNSEQLNYQFSANKIKAAYRDGSRPPVSLIKYPIVTEDVSQSAPDQSSRPLYEATSALLSR